MLEEKLYNLLICNPLPSQALRHAPVTPVHLEQWQNGVPMIRLNTPEIDLHTFVNVASKVGEALKENAADPGHLDRVLEVISSERETVVPALLQQSYDELLGLAQKYRLPAGEFFAILTQTLQPFVRLYGQTIAFSLDLNQWMYGYCPVCGGEPYLACLADTGKRHLFCSLCGFKWPYKRLGCPYCGNTDPHKISFLEVGDGAYRLYMCEVCKRYLKAVDERKARDKLEDPHRMHISTGFLDALAVDQGYGT
ncbi:MAG: formate dehydrogenase accessory protein FdhE [Thermoanaerobacteraceae bacterium]|nr:formate dehydrogenase accessory protein FdhE [Thermoanaerobacteraceae bacterium]